MIKLKNKDLIIFEDRVLKVVKVPYSKGKGKQGMRVILKLLDKKELNDIVLKGSKN